MDGFSSECSSGCESGWTMYLDQSAASSPNAFNRNDTNIGDEEGGFLCEEEYKPKGVEEEEEEDDEDLSMVSDASSGPPPYLHEDDQDYYDDQYHHHHRGYFYSASALPRKSDKRQKIKLSSPATQHHHHHSLLDDTASSPVFNFPKQVSRENTMDIPQGFSATPIKGRSALHKHFGYLQSSMPGKPTSAKPVACRKESGSRRW